MIEENSQIIVTNTSDKNDLETGILDGTSLKKVEQMNGNS